MGLGLLDTKAEEGFDTGLPGQDFTGNELTLSPDVNVNGIFRYFHSLADMGNVALQLDFNYLSDHYFSIDNSPFHFHEGYSVWNGRIGYKSANERYSLSFAVENLFDKEYLNYSVDFTPLLGMSQLMPGRPPVVQCHPGCQFLIPLTSQGHFMKKAFLTQPFGGYYHTEPELDLTLTAVENKAVMGEVLRQVWQPVALCSEIETLPRAVRMFGEDLVVFRTRQGKVAILARHCSHRGTSLEFGIPSVEGIRCCYHGWHYAVNGQILDTPGDPPTSKLKDQMCHPAYPAIEYNGIVFGYFGPPEEIPEFPIYDSYEIPGDKLVPYSLTYPCNWLQVHENVMDPVHAVFLHTRVTFSHFTDTWGLLPDLQWLDTPTGMIYITTRRQADHVWIRSNDIILPNLAQVGYVLEGGGAPQKLRQRRTGRHYPLDYSGG